jgi:mRNA interferase MazF
VRRGKTVLTPFPYTDLSGRKVRPAVVVSRSDRTGSDVLLAFITSDRGQPLQAADLRIESSDPAFPGTGLKTASVVRLDKLVTVEQSILLGELGELSADLVLQMDSKLRYALEL